MKCKDYDILSLKEILGVGYLHFRAWVWAIGHKYKFQAEYREVY